jgi:UDP-glucose 4-epimerase
MFTRSFVHALLGSHVIYSLQETRQYKVISIDNHHNAHPKSLSRVEQIARNVLPPNPSERDKESTEVDRHGCDLTKPDQVREVFAKYGKGGIWGVIHIAVCLNISTYYTRLTPF